jgi:hypothetical protein
MHGPLETQSHEDVSFHGEVWTDARGQATVSLPPDAYPPQAELEYALQAIEGDSGVRVVAPLREGRFTIVTDQPHVKVAWRVLDVRAANGPLHSKEE